MATDGNQEYFALCSMCKSEIDYGESYYVCSVSTCRSKRKELLFCSVPCWDSHIAVLRHRSAYCEELRAPRR